IEVLRNTLVLPVRRVEVLRDALVLLEGGVEVLRRALVLLVDGGVEVLRRALVQRMRGAYAEGGGRGNRRSQDGVTCFHVYFLSSYGCNGAFRCHERILSSSMTEKNRSAFQTSLPQDQQSSCP